jgi:FHS family L-fucose permease-like MFS transporter
MAKSGFWAKRSLRVPDDKRTKAAELTLRESIYPIIIVTILCMTKLLMLHLEGFKPPLLAAADVWRFLVVFLWGFSYGLLDTLNRHFQITLGIDKARSAGLQAAYFGFVSPSCCANGLIWQDVLGRLTSF